jgi:hypothetical protein
MESVEVELPPPAAPPKVVGLVGEFQHEMQRGQLGRRHVAEVEVGLDDHLGEVPAAVSLTDEVQANPLAVLDHRHHAVVQAHVVEILRGQHRSRQREAHRLVTDAVHHQFVRRVARASRTLEGAEKIGKRTVTFASVATTDSSTCASTPFTATRTVVSPLRSTTTVRRWPAGDEPDRVALVPDPSPGLVVDRDTRQRRVVRQQQARLVAPQGV